MAYRMGGALRRNSSHLVVLTDDDFEALTPDQRADWKGYTYKMTYETWDEESVEIGETDDKGWIEEGSEPYDSLQDVMRAARDHNWLEWSSSPPDGRSWITSESEEDYSTGERTNHDLWIERGDKQPLSHEEMAFITKGYGLHGMRRNAVRQRRNGGMLDSFTRGYLAAALFSTSDESREDGGDPLDDNYSISDFAPDALAKAKADCDRFQEENADDLSGFDSEEAGADFWFTRCGHGVGFWDGDYPEPQATRLTDACEKFGEVWLTVGDDGLIYSSQ